MPEEIQIQPTIPDPIQAQVPPPQMPPVIEQANKKSSVKPLLFAIIFIVIVAIAYGAYSFLAMKNIKTNVQITNLSTTTTINSDLPTNNSDTQLNKDINNLDTQTSGLDKDLNSIDQGLNDQSVNLQ
jgi:uncharacterized protein HemX